MIVFYVIIFIGGTLFGFGFGALFAVLYADKKEVKKRGEQRGETHYISRKEINEIVDDLTRKKISNM